MIQVPQNVVTKYFSSQEILNKFLKKQNRENLNAILQDVINK